MAQEARKPAAAHAVNSHADTDLVVGIAGKYLVVPQITFDPANPEHVKAFNQGCRDALTRNGQSAEKQGKLAEFAANPKVTFGDGGQTIGSMRTELAREMCRAKLVTLPKFAGKEVNDATVDATLPIYIGKYRNTIEQALAAKLAAGYTPTKRGEGGKAAPSAVTVEADEI